MFEVFVQIEKSIFTEAELESMISKFIPKIETLLEIEKKYFSIILTDDEFIKSMNNEYRKKDCATDVLSFPTSDSVDDIAIESIDNEFMENEDDLGEIYISIETAIRQADEFKVSIEDELKRLVVHGILHLMGFDHEKSDEDEKIMNEREDFVLSQLKPQSQK